MSTVLDAMKLQYKSLLDKVDNADPFESAHVAIEIKKLQTEISRLIASGTATRTSEAALPEAEELNDQVEVGRIYKGKVVKLMDFGAFVSILPGRDGLVHISQISEEPIEKVSDKLKEGDVVKVKVLEVDKQGRVRLSMKDIAATRLSYPGTNDK